VSLPVCQVKAEFFRTLGHPVRIRVLELLQGGPKPVRDLLSNRDGLLAQLRTGQRS